MVKSKKARRRIAATGHVGRYLLGSGRGSKCVAGTHVIREDNWHAERLLWERCGLTSWVGSRARLLQFFQRGAVRNDMRWAASCWELANSIAEHVVSERVRAGAVQVVHPSNSADATNLQCKPR